MALGNSDTAKRIRNRHLAPLGLAARRIMSLILQNPGISQNEIVQRVDFTQQYVSKLLKDLQADHLIKATGTVTGSRGQPRVTLEIEANAALSFGVALMTDAIEFTLVDLAGDVRASRHQQISSMTLNQLASTISDTLSQFCAETGTDLTRITGVGLGVTGYFIGDGHKVNPPAPLDSIALVDLEEFLTNSLGLDVRVDNDGNTAVLAESMAGVGRWAETFAYFYLSAGFGGGLVIDGKLYRGRNGNAGEFANIIRQTDEYPTLRSLREKYAASGKEFSTIDEMLEASRLTDAEVIEWMDQAVEPLSRFASAVAAILDPDAIVFGGRLPTELAEALISKTEIFNSDRRHWPKPVPRMVPAEAPRPATAIGAGFLPFLNTFYSA